MPTAPLDLVMVAINSANTRLNGRVETLQAIGGQVLGNTQAFSQQIVNNAWRKMQNRLAESRYSILQTETVLTGVIPVASTDPVTQVYIDYTGYFDGVTLQAAPVLPQNFIRPYELTERQNGTGALFTEMDPLLFALPRVPKMPWNRSWLWRNQKLYMPGALVATDISIVYAQLFPDFVDATLPWFQQLIPIVNCIDTFADYICREISVARQDLAGASAFQMSAEDNARLLVNEDTTGPKSIVKASELGKMRDRFTPGAPVPPPELK